MIAFVKIRTFVGCSASQIVFEWKSCVVEKMWNVHTFNSNAMADSMRECFAISSVSNDLTSSNIDTGRCRVFSHLVD